MSSERLKIEMVLDYGRQTCPIFKMGEAVHLGNERRIEQVSDKAWQNTLLN